MAIGGMKLRPKAELIIALEDLDFSWHETEIERVIEMWQTHPGIYIAIEEV